MQDKYLRTDTIFDDFENHLNIKNNNRIILSGRFGSGKTVFLKNFFNEKPNLLTVRISPSTYSIDSTYNIIQYLEKDILFQLVTKNSYSPHELNPSLMNKIWLFSQSIDSDSILSSIDFVNKLSENNGDPKSAFFLSFVKHLNKSQKQLKNLFSKVDCVKNLQSDQINKFMATESDLISSTSGTSLIFEALSKVKQEGNIDESILVIDDLDRLDPELIFKLLNILTARLDYDDFELGEDFYGFDRIILVCDIENIRSIFHHRYGISTNFNGYVRKFYSHKIYDFLPEEYVLRLTEDVINSIKIDEKEWNRLFYDFTIRDQYLIKIISKLCGTRYLTFRHISEKYNAEFQLNKRKIEAINIHNTESIGLLIFDFLIWLFGDYNELLNAVDNAKDHVLDKSLNHMYDFYYNQFHILNNIPKHNFIASNYFQITNKEGNKSTILGLYKTHNSNSYICKLKDEGSLDKEVYYSFNLFELMHSSLLRVKNVYI